MRNADKAKRYMVVQSVRQEAFFRLRKIFDKLKKSLTSTEGRDQDVTASSGWSTRTSATARSSATSSRAR